MKVSVIMITYGHAKFIAQSIEAVLMQKHEGEIELIIANDKSPDDTSTIVSDIIKNHPNGHWIKYKEHITNLGMMSNFLWALREAKGEYIAICDGDDYWTDPYKLQKQVDLLEKHKNLILVGHSVDILRKPDLLEVGKIFKNSYTFKQNDLLEIHVPTLSVVYRNQYQSLPSDFKIAPHSDFLLWTYLGQFGDFFMLNERMAVYRIHDGGVWSGSSPIDRIKNNYVTSKIALKFAVDKKQFKKNTKSLCRSGIFNSFKIYDFKNLSYFVLEYLKLQLRYI